MILTRLPAGRAAARPYRIFLLLLFVMFCWARPAGATEVYYLFDNSASMYDGYPAKRGTTEYYYRRPEFQEFVRRLVAATAQPDDQVSIITFNRVTNTVLPPTAANAISWESILAPRGQLDVIGAQSKEDIRFTRMPDALRELLAKLNGRNAVIWLLTDNIADRGASQEAADTREFYTLLATEPRVQMVYAYPLRRAPINTASMLMIYGITVGGSEPFTVQQLQQWESGYLSVPPLLELMAEQPFKMKPLGRNTLELALKETLKLDAVDESSPLTGTVDLLLRSRFNYHTVTSATVELVAEDLNPERESISKIAGNQFQFSPPQPYVVKEIQPRQSVAFTVTFQTPRVDVSPLRNRFATLMDDIFDENFTMHGIMRARVSDVRLRLDLPPEMKGVFGAEDIPEIFRPQTVNMDELKMEIAPTVRNSGGRLLLFLLLCTLLGAGLIIFCIWFFMPQNYYLSYDDSFEFYKRYSLRRKGEVRIKSDSGEVLGRLCRGWSDQWRFVPNRQEFKRVADSYSQIALARAEASDDDIAYRLFIRTKRPAAKGINHRDTEVN